MPVELFQVKKDLQRTKAMTLDVLYVQHLSKNNNFQRSTWQHKIQLKSSAKSHRMQTLHEYLGGPKED